MDVMCNYLPGDPRLVEQIVKELKSQGIFDQFRKECISDVDTKPAYQNLRQRVEGSVSNFLKEQKWSPDMNKNQVREMLRKHIHESGFLETGVERIVDQVVNPKINNVFIPKVDEVMYKFLGIERPKEKHCTPLEINTVYDLLPKDLEAISPELPEEKDSQEDNIVEAKPDEKPPNSDDNDDKIMQEENSVDSQSSVLSGIVSQDSNNSLKQDSVMSLNSSESRMSPVNNSKIESEDTCYLSQKSSDSNSKTEILSDEKMNTETDIETKEDIDNLPETCSEKSSDENKSKSTDKKRDKHHSSSHKSKSRNDKEREKSRSDKPKKDENDGKSEEKKYKIPKLSDKNKDNKSKDKEDKHRSDKERSERDSRSDRDKKYDKDKKSKHSSERSSSSRDKSEKKDKDEKKDRKESSRSEKSRDDKRSSSSKKRESNSSRDKDKESKSNKEEISEKNKNDHSSSSSKRDSKSHKDDGKNKSSHKKDEKNDKEDRKRKRRSKDDHHSSKEKRNGGRSSDRDSDGPSNSKRPHVSSQSNGNYSTQQTSQDSSVLNSESSSGYSGNSDKAEDTHEDANNKAILEMKKIKLPKFASNMNEAIKIVKIRKLWKKLDIIIKENPHNPEIQKIIKDIEKLTKDIKQKKKEYDEEVEENEDTDENEKTEESKSASINIEDFISSSNISMAKWNALEAKFMEQITQVDYNSYESPYVDEDEVSFEQKSVDDAKKVTIESNNPSVHSCVVSEVVSTSEVPDFQGETPSYDLQHNIEINSKSSQPILESISNCSESNEIYSESKEIHIESMVIHGESNDIHSGSNDVHSESNDVHSESNYVHSESNDVHSESNDVHSESNDVHSELNEINSELNEINSESNEIQSESNEIQSESNEIQSESNENHSESNEIQSESNEIHSESNETHSASKGIHSEPKEINNESKEINNEPKEINSESNMDSVELNVSKGPNVSPHISEKPTDSEFISSESVEEKAESKKDVKICNGVNVIKFEKSPVVLLQKHALTEEMLRIKAIEEAEERFTGSITRKDDTCNVEEIEKENIEVNVMKDEIDGLTENMTNSNCKEKGLSREHTENNLLPEESACQDVDIYSLQSPCVVCLDSKGDVFKGFEKTQNSSSKSFIRSFMETLERHISMAKQTEEHFRKRKVMENNSDLSNNNSAPKRQEVEIVDATPNHSSISSQKINLRSKPDEIKAANSTSEIKNRRRSGVGFSTPDRVDQVNAESIKSVEKPSDKKIRTNQRYSSEELYKPRIFLRRSGRESKNP